MGLLVAYFAFDLRPRLLETIAHTAGIYFPLLLGGRLAFRALSSHPRLSQRVLIVGTSDLALAIARAVRERRNLGTEIAGFLSDDFEDQGAWVEGYPVLGRVHEVGVQFDEPIDLGEILPGKIGSEAA